MRPTPVPDHEIWEGARRMVIAPPDGDLTNPTIAPVEAVADQAPDGSLNLSVRCVLEDGDLDKLQAGGTVWITFWGHMVPWAITTVAPVDPSLSGERPSQRLEPRTADTRDCPDEAHQHRWHRPELMAGTDVAYTADARGQVAITEEALTRLLRGAGFVPEVSR